MSRDRITLQGLSFYGYHGALPEETRLGQRFVIDVDMGLDTRAAGRTDDLAKTVHYGLVYEDIKAIVQGSPFQLIEALAEAIATRILGAYAVDEVGVRVRKPSAPVPGPLEYVEVEIHRTREEQV